MSWATLLGIVAVSCVPGPIVAERAQLTLQDEGRVSLDPSGTIVEVELFLQGQRLDLALEACDGGSEEAVCRWEGLAPGDEVALEATAGQVEAAAVLWRPAGGGPPYALAERARGPEGARTAWPRQLVAPNPDRAGAAWFGDPASDGSSLSAEAQAWYDELLTLLGESQMAQSAATGNLYHIGRYVNLHVTALLLAFSETGDLRILDGIDEAMQIARNELRDPWLDGTTDGYLGWLFTQDSAEGSSYYGRDDIELDDMMAHGMVAAVTYAYYLNRFQDSPSGVDYNERFEFWSAYLIDHYEAKWRVRTDRPEGFPFVEKGLTHPTIGMLRYLHYMGRIGYPEHEQAARDLAEAVAAHFQRVDTDGGPAYVYDHGFGDPHGMTPTTYARYTLPVALELAVTGLPPFDEDFVAPFGNTVGQLILRDPPFTSGNLLAPDVAGGIPRAGIAMSARAEEEEHYGSNRLPGLVPYIAFDESGRTLEAVEALGSDVDGFRLVLAAGMVYALAN